ncbi:MAG: carbohydrate kinase family protein [bacterium]|nr:carbohydrate kinase family protein [bacterium]
MNFLVIGHSVVDKIKEERCISTKPGGIFYTVVSLLGQKSFDDKLFLCSSIDKESGELFEAADNQIERDFITAVDSIPTVELVVNKTGERNETYSKIGSNLKLPSDLRRFDGILINMITGYDISHSQLKQLRNDFKGLIYFDVHTLSRGVDDNMNRVFRRIEAFNEWAECVDILQANESELMTLSHNTSEADILNELFSYGIKQIIITKAEKGATVYFKSGIEIKRIHKDAIRVNVKNKIGCGDVFGAVYFYNYIKNKNVTLALEQANLFAGVATTLSSTEEFLNLKRYANEWISKK